MFTRGAGDRADHGSERSGNDRSGNDHGGISATYPLPAVPGEIQVRRCQWIVYTRSGILAWKHAGYLIIVAPGVREWRPTRRRAIDRARVLKARGSHHDRHDGGAGGGG